MRRPHRRQSAPAAGFPLFHRSASAARCGARRPAAAALCLLLLAPPLLAAPAAADGSGGCASLGSPAIDARTRGQTRELRLGVVLYGGVSLAIYMHGQTRELQNLVIASRAHEAGLPRQELAGTVAAYYDALEEIGADDGVKTRVVIDSIAGTSAGGINGIFLAKALAHDQSQAGLRDLWMERGDIWQLLGGSRLRGFLRLARLAVGLPFGKARPPLDGDAMLRWAHQALEEMGTECPGASLVPPGERLHLFVPTTDFRGRSRGFVIGEPATGLEKEHRTVLSFTFERPVDGNPRGTADPFRRANNPFLAFTVRATSSFPGAFPPIHLADLEAELPAGTAVDLDAIAAEHFADYALDGSDVGRAWFVDGGVLDNYPFGHVIDDLQRRAAARQVERRLIYLQPDPGAPPATPSDREPALVGTVWGALSTIARAEPIGDDFRTVEEFNARVRFVDGVIGRVHRGVVADPELLVMLPLDRDLAPAELPLVTRAIETYAAERSALTWDAYRQVRAQAVIEQLGRAAAADRGCALAPTQQALLVATLGRWAEERGLTGAAPDAAAQARLLDDLDPGYLWRQLRFVSDVVNDLYPQLSPGDPAGRRELDEAQAALAHRVEEARRLMGAEGLPATIRAQLGALCRAVAERPLTRPLALAAADLLAAPGRRASLDRLYDDLLAHVGGRQREIRAAVGAAYHEITADWPAERRDTVYLHYLGFPLWDVVVYPYQRLADAGELQPVEVARMSPDDTRGLGTATAAEKLGGTRVGHFGAFFQRHRREQDYLWGRLDGAERILALLYSLRRDEGKADGAGAAAGPTAAPPAERLRAAFTAVIDEERDALPTAGRCLAALDALLQRTTLPAPGDPIPPACGAR
ncbi:MAG TPA: patatin-like protein [Thermoanaerobaculia bacterium]|nr:patatin-like protein [Thermoanaerobaculia bacterium]